MARILLDSDVVIDHLRGAHVLKIPRGDEGAYSTILRAEVYAGRHVDEDAVDRILDVFEELPVNRPVAEEAGRIRRLRDLALPDAIIAATALLTHRVLLTRNVRHFRRVPGLRVRAPR